MCGRFALDQRVDDLIREFVAEGGDFRGWQPSWNIAPTDPVPLLIHTQKDDEELKVRLEPARWWLVPSWSKSLQSRGPMFNVRSEDIMTKSSWKKPVQSRRAIVPMTGYYEWQTAADGKTKTPHFIYLPDGELMGVAAIFDWWRNPEKDGDDPDRWLLSTSILTSDAVDNLIGIHDRNPVPLPREMWDWWLDPTTVGDQAMVDEAVRMALSVAGTLQHHQVAPLRGNRPELILPV